MIKLGTMSNPTKTPFLIVLNPAQITFAQLTHLAEHHHAVIDGKIMASVYSDKESDAKPYAKEKLVSILEGAYVSYTLQRNVGTNVRLRIGAGNHLREVTGKLLGKQELLHECLKQQRTVSVNDSVGVQVRRTTYLHKALSIEHKESFLMVVRTKKIRFIASA